MKKIIFSVILLILTVSLLSRSLLDQLLMDGTSPESVDHRYCQSSVKNQGGRLTCTAFSITAAMEVFPGVPADLSEQFLYASAKLNGLIDSWDVYGGEYMHVYLKVLQSYGTVREEQEPYNPMSEIWGETDEAMDKYTAEVAGSRIYDLFESATLNTYRVMEGDYEYLEGDLARHGIATIKERLAGGILCIPVGYTIYLPQWEESSGLPEDAYHPDQCLGVIIDDYVYSFSEAKNSYPDLADRLIWGEFMVVRDTIPDNWGGHAVSIVGYTPDGFIIKNSWDTDWGDQGYAFVSYDFHELYCNEVLIINKVTIYPAMLDDRPEPDIDPEFRLKVLPKIDSGSNSLYLSLYTLEDGKTRTIENLIYSLYTLDRWGEKDVIFDRTVLLPSYIKAYGYNALIYSPRDLSDLHLTGDQLCVDIIYKLEGIDQQYTRTYRNIGLETADHVSE